MSTTPTRHFTSSPKNKAKSSNPTVLTFLATLLLALSPTTPSLHRIEMTLNEVTMLNPCNTAMLSNFFDDITPNSEFHAKPGNRDVLNFCPTLKNTCCQKKSLEKLASELKDSIQYMNYRAKLILDVFDKVKDIATETYTVFLSEMTEEDTQCYDEIQLDNYNKKAEKYKENEELLKVLESTKNRIFFDKEQLLSNFKKLLETADGYQNVIKETYQFRERYFAGFICSMCSPSFSRYFSIDDENVPHLELNKFMCVNMIKNQIQVYNSVFVFKYLQELINVTYCAKKNSKKHKDYNEDPLESYNMLLFDMEMVSHTISKWKTCVTDNEAFLKGEDAGVNCLSACQRSLDLFSISMGVMDKFLLIENELHNMFFSVNGPEYARKRYATRLEEYQEIKQTQIEKGNLKINPVRGSELIAMLKVNEGSTVNFKNTKITVNEFGGLNVINTPMTTKYYIGVGRLGAVMVLSFLLAWLF